MYGWDPCGPLHFLLSTIWDIAPSCTSILCLFLRMKKPLLIVYWKRFDAINGSMHTPFPVLCFFRSINSLALLHSARQPIKLHVFKWPVSILIIEKSLVNYRITSNPVNHFLFLLLVLHCLRWFQPMKYI